jgi:O-antigen/teichoic acid export membrane protein
VRPVVDLAAGKPISGVSQLGSRVLRTLRTSHGVHHASGTAVLQVLRMITLFGAARVLGPANWGIWGVINLVVSYSPNLHLGTLNAANRMIPIWRSENRLDLVAEAKATTLATFIAATCVVSSVAITATAVMRISLVPLVATVALYALSVHVWTWALFMLRAEEKFGALGKGQLVLGLATLSATPLAIGFGPIGLAFGFCFGNVCAIASVVTDVGIPSLAAVSWVETKRLMRDGQGLLAAGFLFGSATTIDRWILSTNRPLADLGIYTFAFTLTVPCAVGPQTLADVFYARMLRSSRGSTSPDLRPLMYRQFAWSCASFIAAYVCVGMGVLVLLPHWFREFGASTPLFWILGLIPLAHSLAFVGGNVLNTLGKHNRYLLLQTAFLAEMITTCVVVNGMGLGLRGMAIGVLVTTTASAMAIAVTGWKAALNE